jgi:hypothetical protein
MDMEKWENTAIKNRLLEATSEILKIKSVKG